MRPRRADGRASTPFARYLAFQVPGCLSVAVVMVGLRAVLDVPLWIGMLVVMGWIIKDLALFPLLRSAYEHPSAHTPSAKLAGRLAVVDSWSGREGWVRLGHERWRAVTAGGGGLEPGTRVRVADVQGLTITVEPADEPPPRANHDAAASGTDRKPVP